MVNGKLYIVPTPIGNLEDITLRALRILKEVDIILAEDTRTSGNLLKHFEIDNKLMSYHQHNEHGVLPKMISLLQEGKNLALVTDAGTPGISDPGYLLIRECVRHNLPIEPLPGATAFVPALLKSGFPCDEFVYIGFLPQKKGRQTAVQKIAEDERTTVMYESPHRLIKLLEQLVEFCDAERKISVSRELTKKFEETINGTVTEVLQHFLQHEPRGEFVVVVEGKGKTKPVPDKL
ncbi:MAG: 16S rRNA (cytidine(1402)-2'-O)-methyltransferase [Bacteroidia bacterium]|nr:16S rRNA (cytidine(1402)-2'-O)-methyltransferase [Bacteroidia bacterium]MBP9725770.1 16S rRNA (cytidine(1402)-2'-O)-methyltransferase [Bacteroidia bacterium]